MSAHRNKYHARIMVMLVSFFMVFGNVASPLSEAFYVHAQDDEVVSDEAVTETQPGDETEDAALNEDADKTLEASSDKASEASDTQPAQEEPAEAPKQTNNATLLRSAPKAAEKAIYIDGANGKNKNDGLTAESAVKTWDKALELLGSDPGTIYVCGTVSVRNETISMPKAGIAINEENSGEVTVSSKQSVKRNPGFTQAMFEVTGNVTFKNIVIDGEGVGAKDAAVHLKSVDEGGGEGNTLNILDKTVFINNKNTTGDGSFGGGAIRIGHKTSTGRYKENGGNLNINGGYFLNNESSTQGGAIFASGRTNITVYAGTFVGNKAYRGSVIANYASYEDNQIKIYNALITENKSTGTYNNGKPNNNHFQNGAGGVVICTSNSASVRMFDTDGAAIYGNTGAKNEKWDISVWTNGSGLHTTENMLGGGKHNWSNKNGNYGKVSNPSQADRERAERLATTIIRNNTSNADGAIMSNGVITLGRDVTDFALKKLDGFSKQPIGGVEFTLEGGGETKTLTTSSQGILIVGKLKDNTTYTLRETGTPAGYIPADVTWTVYVDGNGIVTIKDSNNRTVKPNGGYYEIENQPAGSEEPMVEKYINGKVHQDLGSFDETFEYSVMAYVPNDATEITISDKLVETLMFVDNNGNNQYLDDGADNPKFNQAIGGSYQGMVLNSADYGYQLVWEDANDHKGDVSGRVSGHSIDPAVVGDSRAANNKRYWISDRGRKQHVNGPILNSGYIKVDGDTITVTIDESTGIKDVQGKWVVLSFNAAYKPSYYDMLAVKNNNNGWLNESDNKQAHNNAIDTLVNIEGAAKVEKVVYDERDGGHYYAKVGKDYYQTNKYGDGKWYRMGVDSTGSLSTYTPIGGSTLPLGFENEIDSAGKRFVGINESKRRFNSNNVITVYIGGEPNYPVVEGTDTNSGRHEGTANQAEYTVTQGHNPATTYETNIVTVKPEELIFEASKKWQDPDGRSMGNEWPEGAKVAFSLYMIKDGEERHLQTSNEIESVEEKAVFASVPKLANARYEIRETISGVGCSLDMNPKITTGGNTTTYEFTNKLTKKEIYPAKLILTANKEMLGRSIADYTGSKAFQFKLEGGKTGNTVNQTKKNDASGKVTFDAITFDEEGEYTYTIKEVIPSKPEEGMTYSDATKTIKVTVEKEADINSISYKIKSVVDENGNDLPISSNGSTGEVQNVTADAGKFTNKLEEIPEVAKYVNSKVHANLKNFDEIFDYSIVAYVPYDATEFTISDRLTEDILFVDADGNVQGTSGFNKSNVVVNKDKYHGLVIEDSKGSDYNLGNGRGRVSMHNDSWFDNNPGRLFSAEEITEAVTVDGKTITVHFTEEMMDAHKNAEYGKGKTDNDIRGKSVILTFKAVINPDSYDKVLNQINSGSAEGIVDGLRWKKVTDDKSTIDNKGNSHSEVKDGKDVESDGSHAGLLNNAEYTVTTNLGGESTYKTNTVTVKPETEDLKVKKTWGLFGLGSWPENTTVTFGIFRSKNGGEEEAVKGSFDNGKFIPGGEDDATVTLSEDNAEMKLSGLPCLERVSYSAREISVNNTVDGTSTAVNSVNGGIAETISGAIKYIVEMANRIVNGENEFTANNRLAHKVKINKTDLGGKEVYGAKIEIKDGTGEDAKIIDSWTSSAGTRDIFLEPGTYYMVETFAPSGYQKVETAIEFEVDDKGKVEVKTTSVDPAGAAKVIDGVLVLMDAPEKGGEIEKYVENQVHEEIVNFDKEFEYEVLAYVPLGATKATIEDTLVDGLVFAGKDNKGDVSLVYLEGDYSSNNHQVHGSVENAKTVAFKDGKPKVDVKGKKITVEISDGNGLRQVWGKWVKMTFKAKIDLNKYDELLERIKTDGKSGNISWQRIKDNKTVQDGSPADPQFSDHQGVDNTAQYTVEFGNDFKSDHESNTVTVKPETFNIDGEKLWDDEDNQDGKRPESITIRLLLDGTEIASKTVTAADNWKWSFDKLKKFANKTYSISEDAVTGYEKPSITGDAANGYTVKNTYKPEKTNIDGKKTWDDEDNQDGKRPSSITIRLLANGTEVDSKTVTEKDGWTWKFDNLNKFENGKEIDYTISEDAVADYNTAVNGYNVTNSYTPGKTSIPVTKIWDDANNQDGIRPASVKVNLLADGTVVDSAVLNEQNGWTHTFNDLPLMKAGQMIKYTVEEDGKVTGYTTIVSGYNVTNKHTPETTEVPVEKLWADGDNQDGIRPASVKVQLYADGVANGAPVELNDANNWKYTFTGLDKYNAGNPVKYTVDEIKTNVITGTDASGTYAVSITGDAANGYKVTNTHTPEKTKVEGSKTWNDNDDQDGKRPSEITINLYADGQKIGTQKVSAQNNWMWSFTGLDKFKNGVKINYTITEDKVTDYNTAVDGYDVTNTHEPETTKVSGSKTWNDADDQDGKRPASITIRLLANGKEVDSKTVTADDNWAYEFTDLPKYKDGQAIVYTVTEDAVTDYTTAVNGYDVTNSYTPGKTQVNVVKVWNDDNNRDGVRPSSITVKLLADGADTGKTATLDKDNSWSTSFTELPEMKKGKKIAYTIEEVKVSGYTSEITGGADQGFTLTNTHEPEKTSIEGSKTWNDAKDQDGNRPSEITINLLANGTKVDETTVTADNGWKYEFTDLPKYESGQEINYTVTENTVDHYASEIDGANVINTYTVPEKYVNNEVTWDFENFNQEFEYEIMAFVTKDGKSLTISDTLVDALQLVGENGEAKVYKMGEGYGSNNHQENGSVKEKGDEITDADISVEGRKTLKVEIKDATSYQNHWIKVTFNAQIKPEAYERVKSLINNRTAGAEWADINDNGLVISKKEHDGVPNKATYSLTTENDSTFTEETNTVTVEPKTTKIRVKKTWGFLGLGQWPKDTSVTFGLFANDEALKGSVSADGKFTLADADDANAAQATVVLTTDNHEPVTVTGLPRLKGVKYTAREISVKNSAGTANVAYDAAAETGTAIKDAIKYLVTLTEGIFKDNGEDVDEFTANNELKVTVKFSKTDLGGEELPGAEMKLYKGDKAVGEPIDSWTSTATAYDLELEPGTYTLKEVAAPKGYQTVTTDMVFVVQEDGKVVLKIVEVDNGGVISVEKPGTDNHIKLADAPVRPEVEKYVNKAVHKYIGLDEVFTYDIIGYISMDADKIVFEDTLVDDLEFADENSVEVVSLDENNHKPLNNIDAELVNEDASVAKAGTPVEGAKVAIDEQKLTVTIDGDDAVNVRGKYVKVTFKAQIKKSLQEDIKAGKKTLEDLEFVEIKENNPVVSDEAHDGIVNDATLMIEVDGEGKYEVESNTVTVKPELPEIEKYVNQAVHKDIELTETFTYDVIAYVTKDASKVVIKDTLNDDLEFACEAADVKVADMGTEDNHKVTNNVASEKVNGDATVAAEGTEIADAEVSIQDDTLTVTIADAGDYRGHWVRVTFDAKIAEGKKISDLKYTTIEHDKAEKRDAPNVGNDPVISDEDHTGVPNKAGYKIYVKNEASVETGNDPGDNPDDNPGDNPDDTPDEPKYEDESNTVTVKPVEKEVKINKTDLGGSELEGAEMVLTDIDGNVIDEWTSGKEDHVLNLADGEYVLKEKVAPEGYYCVETDMIFEVKDGEVTLKTAVVDNGGQIEVLEGNKIVLKDAPEVKGDYVEFNDGGDESKVRPAYEDSREAARARSARTGDDTTLTLWIMILIVACSAVAVAAIRRRRNKA